MKSKQDELDRLVMLWQTRRPMSRQEMSDLFGVSRHKIINIEKRALEKIKKILETSR